jgi:hypothetical protein
MIELIHDLPDSPPPWLYIVYRRRNLFLILAISGGASCLGSFLWTTGTMTIVSSSSAGGDWIGH